MALAYDLKTDLRYLAGEENGVQIGVQKGVLIGKAKGGERKQKEIIVEMIKMLPNLPLEEIAKIAKVSADYVRNLLMEMKNKK